MEVYYGLKHLRSECSCHVSYDQGEPAPWWLIVIVCLVALAIGVAAVWILAFVASHFAAGPFFVAFVMALLVRSTFR